MLEFIRNHVGGLLGFLLIGVLAVAFALSFGQQSQGWGKSADKNIAIIVDGTEVSEAALRYAINVKSPSRNLSADSAEYVALRQQAAKGIIERQLLVNLAQKAGITASDDEAQTNIIKGEIYISQPISELIDQMSFSIQFGRIPSNLVTSILVKDGHRVRLGSFKDKSGKFDVEEFNRFLRYSLQIREEELVEQQRLELIALRMRQLLIGGVSVSESELRDAYNRDNNKATLSFVKLSPSAFENKLEPTQEEMTAWITDNQEAIKQYYETNKYKYTNLEKSAKASHILIKADKDASAEEKAAAKQKIDMLLARVKAGENFAELATQNSEDPGSAIKGGDLGYNPRGVMVPEFDEVMFALKPGDVSDVVETQFGYHIIKLDSFREGNISLDDATGEIAEKLYKEIQSKSAAEKAANEYLAALKSGTKIDDLFAADTQEGIPAHLQIKVRDSGQFTSTDVVVPGMGKSKDLVKAAFKLTADNPTADNVFEISDSFFVVQLKERTEPTDKDFEEKKADIHERMLPMKQATWLSNRLAQLMDDAMKSGAIQSSVAIPAAVANDINVSDAPLTKEDETSSKKGTQEAPADETPAEKPAEANDNDIE